MTQSIEEVECKVCGHKWFPRRNEKPRVCPNPTCRSTRWDVGRARPPMAKQRAQARQRRLVKAISETVYLPVLGKIAAGTGYEVFPVEVRWIKPPSSVKAKPGDYCLIMSEPPKEQVIKSAVKQSNFILFRPGAQYLGELAHVEAALDSGERVVYFRKVRLTEQGDTVTLEPFPITVSLESLEVRGVLFDHWHGDDVDMAA